MAESAENQDQSADKQERKSKPDWDHYRALREQWTHEDNLVNHRTTWLILSEGLLFTAYGSLVSAKTTWFIYSFPLFGIAIAAVIGVSIYAALAATDDIKTRFDKADLGRHCRLAPKGLTRQRGKWAARALPFFFGLLWMLAFHSAGVTAKSVGSSAPTPSASAGNP